MVLTIVTFFTTVSHGGTSGRSPRRVDLPLDELPDLGLHRALLADLGEECDRPLEMRHRLVRATQRVQQVGQVVVERGLPVTVTVVQTQELIRAQDPVTEVAFMLGAHKKQNEFWKDTLRAVARHFGVENPEVDMQTTCVDRRRQWRRAGNVWHSAAIRSGLYTMTASMRAAQRRKAPV